MPQRIFLVDDDEDDRELFSLALLQVLNRQAVLLSAYDGEDARQQLTRQDFELPMIVFIDLNMPRMGGKELLSYIRTNELLPGVPVVMYSTSAAPSDIHHALQLGADSYLIKPGSFVQLCAELERIFMDYQILPHGR